MHQIWIHSYPHPSVSYYLTSNLRGSYGFLHFPNVLFGRERNDLGQDSNLFNITLFGNVSLCIIPIQHYTMNISDKNLFHNWVRPWTYWSTLIAHKHFFSFFLTIIHVMKSEKWIGRNVKRTTIQRKVLLVRTNFEIHLKPA